MKLLALIDPAVADAPHAIGAQVCDAATAAGDAALQMPAPDGLIPKLLRSLPGRDPASAGAGAPHVLAATAALARFAPNTLIAHVPATVQARTAQRITPFLHHFLAGYTLHMGSDEGLHLTNIGTGKVFRLGAGEVSRVLAIMRSQTAANIKLMHPALSADSAAFDTLATARIALNRYSAAVPRRASEMMLYPKVARAGALETLADDEIVLEPMLWLKGWIDWDDKRFSHLVITVGTDAHRVEVTEFRSDKYEPGVVETPMGFGLHIDVSHMFSSTAVTVEIEDKTGQRRRWCTRNIWISLDTEAQSVTPLITGDARRTAPDVLQVMVRCDAGPVARVLAWQAGVCIGRLVPDAQIAKDQTAQDQTGRLDLHPVHASAFIHLHVHLADVTRAPVPWLCLSPATGDLASLAQIDHVQVVEGDSIDIAPDKECAIQAGSDLRDTLDAHDAADTQDGPAQHNAPAQWLRDGKPYAVLPAGQSCTVSLAGCAGMVTLECLGAQGRPQSWRLWRHCRDASEAAQTGDKLPGFVLPPPAAAKPPASPRPTRPHLLLLRLSAAATDELYLLSALERLAKRRDFDLDIVDMADDTHPTATSELARKALLRDGTIVVVSRYISTALLETLSRAQARLGGIYYIMDDDVTLAENDTKMPPRYRNRMIGVAHSEFQTLLHLCTRFLVSSQFMADRFASAKTDLVTPPYIWPAAGLEHLDDMSEIRIEYHGSQVHRMDLDAIASALVWIHDRYPHVRIRTYMGNFAPARFKKCDRIDIVKAISWEDYKAAVVAAPAHIALSPMLETPYNHAKSFVKVMDIARLGAAGLYSRRAPYESVITHGRDGLLLENDALIWRNALVWLVDNPGEIVKLARAGQARALELGDVDVLARYWEAQLFAEPS